MAEKGQGLFLGGTEITALQNNRFVFANPFTEEPANPYQFRNDPYSSSLLLAIPGSEFSTLGMTNFYDDVSADIRGTGTSFTADPTGSAAEFFADTETEFASEDYTTSVYVKDAGTWGNLSTTELPFSDSDFVMEGYVWMDERFNKPPFWKVFLRNTSNNISGELGFPGTGTTDLKARMLLNGGQKFSSNTNISFNLNQWYHVAWVRSGSNLYFYFNGTQYSMDTTGVTVNTTGVQQIMGGASALNDGAAGAWQDYRVYIGTDKGYTTSTISAPDSIIEKI